MNIKKTVLAGIFFLLTGCGDSNTKPEDSGSQFNPDINYGSFTDSRDGQTYRTVRIGNLTWMAQNMNYPKNSPPDGLGCYDNDENNCKKYGKLYEWGFSGAPSYVCPSGWRLPDTTDWDNLLMTVKTDREKHGVYYRRGPVELQSQSWKYNTYHGTDIYGFSAMPGGLKTRYDYFTDIGRETIWWSANTIPNPYNVNSTLLYPVIYEMGSILGSIVEGVGRSYIGSSRNVGGAYVRCVRD